ncbi:MAG: hypothetical protein A3I88_01690 [Candidatus Portnoybacteria bacterium RIFCSPLOWO2_12_FULL_39_9]|uniref:Nudix hydrolase domain-containing protein n=1 Tax=Candidatus Portnoybacteria bacterium RIFCSPHIGHO2_12_FULL_38_9 TaxID=1801997 RepID=A0A1G2FH17_9BACT|nr:MAG: hypothetical protein A3H00_02090 [Candidatus Portnoybacteria bacterium RBG_13_40_8]OGZ35809.1 MAG: hypothetical protein A2646_01655 [Candidatus Portnoybacteria bacterium RIFCSPHIGHO2_02_FULL_39_12]OGZ37336.1 MAG: hypothetical protein A3J64_02010 [Candidatus Portnoybacteria bacterium RIFCSPHIGHO2_12_FULL_38_9]OGZ38324.1 MAG: hypothetical protein A3F21_02990 [Candidatus Portnoybacteria bacterium RIFCSPLOWO2_01_FULL_38_39]OGZ39919.1 MAG: hypothetical protein A3I88_01690 [Candidatus Portnoy
MPKRYTSIASRKDEHISLIFYGGTLTPFQIKSIKFPKEEIKEYKFLKIKEALPLLSERIQESIPKCLEAFKNNTPIYLENFY